MSEQVVKRYWPEEIVGTGELVVYAQDYDTLHAEAKALWSTYIALVDKLGIDTERAKTADGKPSDVIVSYVEALRAEIEELDSLRNRQSDLLTQTAIALRGPEPALTRYSHADIPSRVKTVVAELEVARGLLREAREAYAEAIHWEDQRPVMNKIDTFLTANNAPEVTGHIENVLTMVDQGERPE